MLELPTVLLLLGSNVGVAQIKAVSGDLYLYMYEFVYNLPSYSLSTCGRHCVLLGTISMYDALRLYAFLACTEETRANS